MFGFLMGTLQKFQKDSNQKNEQVSIILILTTIYVYIIMVS